MKISKMNVPEIVVEKPFSTLFPVSGDTLDAIQIDMKTNGYDSAFPIIIWEEKNIIVDGHTRLSAAQKLEIDEVPVLFRSFADEDDAILYAFHLQRNRRNLADDDILRCLEVLDNIKQPTRNNKEGDESKLTKKESTELRAKELGTSKSKIEKARTVLEHGNDDIKEAVNSGETSINHAFKEVQEIRRESGELKGKKTTGLASGARYKKTLDKLIQELNWIKDEGWNELSKEHILFDLETIKDQIES